jgi:Fur family transcriptional regulator, peroxide stress response regulator
VSTLQNSLRDAFRLEGVRCTAQRYAILEHLVTSPTHPTAEEIHRAINRRDPRASLATVYKALHAMSRAGLIRELNLGGTAVQFEFKTRPHHHFVCERCGRTEDIDWFEIPSEALSQSLGPRTMRSSEVLVRGICGQCRPN